MLYLHRMKATASFQKSFRKGYVAMLIEENIHLEKRRYRRVRFSEPVGFHLKTPNNFGGCLARDLSEGGIQLTLNEFVPLNSEITLQLKLSRFPKVVDVTGRVAWLQRVPYSDRYAVGLEFAKNETLSSQEIRQFINAH